MSMQGQQQYLPSYGSCFSTTGGHVLMTDPTCLFNAPSPVPQAQNPGVVYNMPAGMAPFIYSQNYCPSTLPYSAYVFPQQQEHYAASQSSISTGSLSSRQLSRTCSVKHSIMRRPSITAQRMEPLTVDTNQPSSNVTSAVAPLPQKALHKVPSPAFASNILYKTSLCRDFMQTNGSCPRGLQCQFAHGLVELRTPQRHPLFHTKLCDEYLRTGVCSKLSRCFHAHNIRELKDYKDITDCYEVIPTCEEQ